MSESQPNEALIDLLALLAFGELQAFDRMAADARLAPDLHRRAVLCEMAASEIGHYRRLVDRLAVLGADTETAVEPFLDALEAYHDRTQPKDWLEALTKAYVGDAVADDFYREVATCLDEADRHLVLDVLHDTRHYEFAAAEIRAAIADDPKVANRLSMWARRLVGEALSQAQTVAATGPALIGLIAMSAPDQAGIIGLFRRLTDQHTRRMTAVGLNN